MSERNPTTNGGSPKKKPGRQPGWQQRKLQKQQESQRSEPTSFLPPEEQQFVPEAPPPAVDRGERFTVEVTPPRESEHYSFDETVERFMARQDFLAMGTQARILVVVVQDVSPSERPHEDEWVKGCESIPEEIRKVVAARNLIHVLHAVGHEGFQVLSVGPGKDFHFPAGQIPYGCATYAGPWLDGSRRAVDTYVSHLGKRGIGVREKVILFCSDFCFGDTYDASLTRFKEWAARDPLVTVIPAVFGSSSFATAAKFAVGEAEVVDLKKVSFAHLFRALSRAVVSASQDRPTPNAVGREVTKAIKASATAPHDQPNRG